MNFRPFVAIFVFLLFSCQTNKEVEYVCQPCDLPCDQLTFNKSGSCPHCKMPLEKKLKLNEITIEEGSGAFLIEGAQDKENNTIKVYYHIPKIFTKDAKVVIVIPGAGRNADSYRDTWVKASETHNTVILSPRYQEKEYGFGDYHLAGLVKDLNLEGSINFVENTNIALLNEDMLEFTFNEDNSSWLFNDFDRIFDLVKTELDLSATSYDLFGHSAGGHILHRMALFQSDSKSHRILASNASFYTLPNFENNYPFGLKSTTLNEEQLRLAFAKNLVVFLGEQDNENETRGTFLRSTTSDEQGLHRLARGTHFYETAKAKAQELNTDFNWQLIVVPNVGHNQEKMGTAAASFLFDE